MSIFRRRQTGAADQDLDQGTALDTDAAIEDTTTAADDTSEDAAAEVSTPAEDGDEDSDRSSGPWDASEVEDEIERLDLGSIQLAPLPGMELRLEVDQENDTITGLQLVLGESAAQVQAFAAPRSGGLWREIRGELAASILAAGGTVDETSGEFGRQLTVRMPQLAPDGRTVFAPAQFLGVDGPRWFLRIVLSGQAAIDEASSAPLVEAIRSFVVVRGTSPMAPRELLPLRLPDAIEPEPEPEPADDFSPFERGPEITEVR